jgi:hypothetical protein
LFLLIDKSYYDYDYELVTKHKTFEDTVKSDEKVAAMMQKFGIGLPTAEKLQEMARRDLEKNV